jgi:hypothetical protein
VKLTPAIDSSLRLTPISLERHNGIVCKIPYPVTLLVTLESGINSLSSATCVVETELHDIVALFLSPKFSF